MQMELITEPPPTPPPVLESPTEHNPLSPELERDIEKVQKCEVGNSVGLLSLPIRLNELTLHDSSQHSFTHSFMTVPASTVSAHISIPYIFNGKQ